jgi:hypothetical protein
MDRETQKIILFAGIGIVAYLWYKKSQEMSSFSNARGRNEGYLKEDDPYDYASPPSRYMKWLKRKKLT